MSNEADEIQALDRLTTSELAERYLHLFGQPVRTRHKAYLVRKIAWRIQSLAQGDLSERARHRATQLANDADVRVMPPKSDPAAPTPTAGATRMLKAPAAATRDPRLPSVGTAIVRAYKRTTIRVIVRDDGFEHEGRHYKTLTAIDEEVTGSHVNGFRFFRLESKS